jgi:hypothetical protein
LPWSVLHIIGKIPKCRCRKRPCMSHLDICSTSYGQKKSRESNWQFDSRPLKVENRPDPACAGRVWHTVENSQGELQVFLKPHPNRRSEQRVMTSQSPRSSNWDNLRIPF